MYNSNFNIKSQQNVWMFVKTVHNFNSNFIIKNSLTLQVFTSRLMADHEINFNVCQNVGQCW